MHSEKHPLSGQEVELIDEIDHRQYPNLDHLIIEDWHDRIAGKSWMNCNGNPAVMIFSIRTGVANYHVPWNDEVVYGKYKGMGILVHVSEIKNYEELIKNQGNYEKDKKTEEPQR